MNRTKNFLMLSTLSLFISILFCAVAPGITLDSIRKEAQQLPRPTSMHIVAIEQVTDNRIVDNNENEVNKSIKKANQYVVSEVNIFLDIQSEQVKEIITDLRDINLLVVQFKIPNEKLNSINLNQSKIILFKGGNTIIFKPEIPDLTLLNVLGPPKYLFDIATYGIIPEKILNSKGDVNVTEYQANGNQAAKIEIAFKTGLSIIVECDPSIGYRYKSIKWFSDSKITQEMLASDYREVDGIYFPFLFINRNYSENGNIEYEYSLSTEQVHFGINLTADDFRIFAPAGTQISDSLISETTSKIGTERYLGIDDVIVIGRNRLQRQ
jgi:hypothetical protein